MSTPTLPVQVLLGVYLGVLTGILPAFVAWGLAVLFRYVTGLTVPSFAVVVLGVAIAGVNGGFMALNDPTLLGNANGVTLVVAVVVVMMLSFYTHNQGDRLGAALPRRMSLRSLRERTLSADVVELVGGRGQVRVRVVGAVEDIEGYPPLPEDRRAAVRDREWTVPAHLALPEIEARVADQLREEFDLAEVSVRVDERARATVAAAPPVAGVSRRVPAGRRAVSVDALLPTGLARGDEVTVLADGASATGRVVAVPAAPEPEPEPDAIDEAGETGLDTAEPEPPQAPRPPTAPGGEGRVTVAVPRADADAVLAADGGRVVVRSRGTRREFELLSLLRRANQRVRRFVVAEGPLDGTTLADAGVRETYGVAVLAVRPEGADRWLFAPRGETELAAGDALFAVGAGAALDGLSDAGVVRPGGAGGGGS